MSPVNPASTSALRMPKAVVEPIERITRSGALPLLLVRMACTYGVKSPTTAGGPGIAGFAYVTLNLLPWNCARLMAAEVFPAGVSSVRIATDQGLGFFWSL